MTRIALLLALPLIVATLSGCVSSRKTTTARTAVERQLIAQSSLKAIDQFPVLENVAGKRYFLDTDSLDLPDQQYTEAMTRLYLLRQGMLESHDADESDVRVRMTAASGGIDDFQLLVGIPEFNFSFVGASLNTPEISLFKKDWQLGRARLGGHALDTDDNALLFEIPEVGAQARYIRHTILFFITWKWTDLYGPY
jgi:hypothetical protein